jgi:antitoxin HicB
MAKKKARVSEGTFDEFFAEQGMLGACEELAIKEIIAEQSAEDLILSKREAPSRRMKPPR